MNEWRWGPTGTGKSRSVRDEFGHSLCNKPITKWWDNYKGEETVLLDDFGDCHKCLGYHLKIWADRYTITGEVKGGHMNIRPKRIIVTSNFHPRDIWKNDDDKNNLEPILRRFKIVHYDKPF